MQSALLAPVRRARLAAPLRLARAGTTLPPRLRACLCTGTVARSESEASAAVVADTSLRIATNPIVKPDDMTEEAKMAPTWPAKPDEAPTPSAMQYEALRREWQQAVEASASFKDDVGPVYIAIDTETWEIMANRPMADEVRCKHTLELGWSVVVPLAPSRTDSADCPPRPFNSLGGSRILMSDAAPLPPVGSWTQRSTHFLVSNNYPIRRNGRYVADNRSQFLFGTDHLPSEANVGDAASYNNFTRIASVHEAAQVLKETIQEFEAKGRQVYLVFHDWSGDKATLRALGFDTSAWQHGPATKDEPADKPRPIRVLDTVKMFALLCGQKEYVGLKTAALALGVNGGVVERMHNAANDAFYTAAVLATMLSGPPNDEMQQFVRARFEKAKEFGRKAVNGPKTWKQPLVLGEHSLASEAVAAASDAEALSKRMAKVDRLVHRHLDRTSWPAAPSPKPGERPTPEFLLYAFTAAREKSLQAFRPQMNGLDALSRQLSEAAAMAGTALEDARKFAHALGTAAATPTDADAEKPSNESLKAIKELVVHTKNLSARLQICARSSSYLQRSFAFTDKKNLLSSAYIQHMLVSYFDLHAGARARASSGEDNVAAGRNDASADEATSGTTSQHRQTTPAKQPELDNRMSTRGEKPSLERLKQLLLQACADVRDLAADREVRGAKSRRPTSAGSSRRGTAVQHPATSSRRRASSSSTESMTKRLEMAARTRARQRRNVSPSESSDDKFTQSSSSASWVANAFDEALRTRREARRTRRSRPRSNPPRPRVTAQRERDVEISRETAE